MKKHSTRFLQGIIVFIGIAVLILMLWEPHLEGRNVHATIFEIYFKDPFLAYIYLASANFFVALYQAFKLLGYIGENRVFSPLAVRALRMIKYCALVFAGSIVGAEGYLMIVLRKIEEDIAGGVMMGLILIFVSVVIAAVTNVFEKLLQNAVKIKSENDLTV